MSRSPFAAARLSSSPSARMTFITLRGSKSSATRGRPPERYLLEPPSDSWELTHDRAGDAGA